jgi:hypothetical protein
MESRKRRSCSKPVQRLKPSDCASCSEQKLETLLRVFTQCYIGINTSLCVKTPVFAGAFQIYRNFVRELDCSNLHNSKKLCIFAAK